MVKEKDPAAAALGRRGGKVSSERKKAAARLNAIKRWSLHRETLAMKLSKMERLSLINQFEILDGLAQIVPEDPEAQEVAFDRDWYRQAKKILTCGYEHEYPLLVEWIYDPIPESSSKMVLDVLDLYGALQESFKDLENKAGIDPEAVKFPGFDGNEESDFLSYARFLREEQRRWTYVEPESDRFDLNSHMPTLDMYARMLEAHDRFDRARKLNAVQIKEILDARRYREER